MSTTDAGDTIVKEIVINAPAARIFEALSDPEQRVKWWGADGRFQATHMESDLRPGGAWMMSGNGMGDKPFIISGEYRRIDPPRLLEFTWQPSWQPNAPHTLVRFDLDENDGATTVRLTHSGLATESSRESHQGWAQILGWLQGYVMGSG